MPKRSIWVWLIALAYAVTAVSLAISWLPLILSGQVITSDGAKTSGSVSLFTAVHQIANPVFVAAFTVFGIVARAFEIYFLLSLKYLFAIVGCGGLLLMNVAESFSIIWAIIDNYKNCGGNCDDLGFGVMVILFKLIYTLISVVFSVVVMIYLRKISRREAVPAISPTNG